MEADNQGSAPDTEEPRSSTDLKADDAAAAVRGLDSPSAVHEFVAGDERKTVQDAAEQRLADLAGTTPVAVAEDAPGMISVGEVEALQGVAVGIVAAEAVPGQPLQAGGSGNRRIRARHPVSAFEHGIEGVPTITATGVDVPASKVRALLDAARSAQTELEEV